MVTTPGADVLAPGGLKERRISTEGTRVINQALVIVLGLGLAGWGHLLVHDLLGAANAWTRTDERFPLLMRSSPGFAGRALLVVGAMLVLVPMLG